MNNILYEIQKKCENEGVELIYLSKFGSHLYGTNTENSDTDFKGIFLPSFKQCVLGKVSKSFNFSTGDEHTRNTKEDVDVSLWSLQYFLHLVSKGETNALDLLFSFTNEKMVTYVDNKMLEIFKNTDKLFDIKNCNAFIGYAIGQAKKYGIKGSRLGILKKIQQITEEAKKNYDPNDRLDNLIPKIIYNCFDSSYCFLKEIKEIKCLLICGKVHQGNITIDDFSSRIKKECNKYGNRTELAEKNLGIDWKAISHAVRCLDQMEELIKSGKIKYPLKTANELLKIKNGEIHFPYVRDFITMKIDEIDKKLKDEDFKPLNKLDNKLVEDIVLNFYNGD
jgi:hypothetical protein